LKILCLHGYRQNDTVFRQKTGALRKIIGKQADLVFFAAPHVVKSINEEDENRNQRGWWFSRENDSFKANDMSDYDKGFQASVDMVARVVREDGPFDGVMGFSQGSALAALIILRAAIQKVVDYNVFPNEKLRCRINEMKTRFPKELMVFKFAILFSGFRSYSSRHSPIYEMIESIKQSTPKLLDEIVIPTLHIIGKEDNVIDTNMSEELLSLFKLTKSETLYHDGGHFIPAGSKTEKPVYIDFLSKMKKICDNITPGYQQRVERKVAWRVLVKAGGVKILRR